MIKGGKVSNLRKIFKGLYRYCECPGKDGNGCKVLIPIIKKDHPVFQRFAFNHKNIGKFGKNAPGYKTGIIEDKKRGYATIIRRHHPYRDKNNRVYLHRYLKELDLGYYITREYDVHHINGDKRDNRPENLEVLLRGDHTRQHNPVIDMTGRTCLSCGIKYEERLESNKRQWYEYKNGFICSACNIKEKRKIIS